MKNLETSDLVALDAAELQQVQGGFGPAAHLAVVAAKCVAMLVAAAAIEYQSRKDKEVKLLENVPKPPK